MHRLCHGIPPTPLLSEGLRVLIADASRFEGVRVIGVDKHAWRRTPHDDKVRHRHLGLHARPRPQWSLASAGHGPGPIPSRSSRTWLATRPQAWREGIEIVAMDGFTGFKSAAASLIPCTRRGVSCTPDRACSPLASSTRFLICSPVMSTSQSKSLGASTRTSSTPTASPTGAPARLSCKPKSPPSPPAVSPPPHRDHQAGKNAQTRSPRHPGLLRPPPTPPTAPPKPSNGRLEHLRGSALGLRNLTHYVTRALLETGGFRPQLHPKL